MFWVVCYDIADDKRRKRIQKIMEGSGWRVQYSVFECELDTNKLEKLVRRLRIAMHEKEDDIRLYPLNEADLKKTVLLGTAVLSQSHSHYIV